jgi:F0F1-type ATP synthase membrane subunit a
MNGKTALAAVVLTHLAVSLVHGMAHSGAQVALDIAGTLFVYIVILIGPLAGLAVSRWRPQTGAWIVALTMSGSLVFGLINHFMIQGMDHVNHVVPAWRSLFASTAALLVVVEAAGAAIGLRDAVRVGRAS